MRALEIMISLARAVALTAFATSAAVGQDVDLELVLAVDVSPSMDVEEQVLQRRGYVAAFRHSAVVEAIVSGSNGRIAVTYVEWAGLYQKVIVPWRIIGGLDEALAFANELASAPMSQHDRTSISGGLLFAAGQFDESPATGFRRAIDISGDGANNLGYPVASTRDAVVERGITINGLPILLRPSPLGPLDVYYQDCVVGGPGAFMITVDDAGGFERAIRQKLVLEIAGLASTVTLAAEVVAPEPPTDCLVGERWLTKSPD